MAVHGPNHLFCSGVGEMPMDFGYALAAAAWAGWYASRGQHGLAENWEKAAVENVGRKLWGGGTHNHQLCVVAIGGEPDAEDVEFLIQMMQICLPAIKKRDERKKEVAATPVAELPATDVGK